MRKTNPIFPFFSLLIFGILGAGWSCIPYRTARLSLTYDHDMSPMSQSINCTLFSELVTKEFLLEYPERILLFDRDIISLSLVSSQESTPMVIHTQEINSCSVGIEADIKNLDLDLIPGANISVPFTGQSIQNIRWQINADKTTDTEPIIWIYALVHQDGNGSMHRIPLFAVPLKIYVVDLWGISPLAIRYLSFGIIGISIIMITRKIKKPGNVIIDDHKGKTN